ncbi:uncharacterized protein At1g15400-like [Telopea speciosissima]|uniref:uncharacterized protein At1g15400-like n=1 Tax=Telopea speciosissima TaxID=54955 RepID=UPI001CC7D99E|nr:uncharacterized protein At1g15400-like [Telopea speciosissima]
MAGLQRSTISFRRQGSSGLVWDDKVLSGELAEMNKQKEEGTEEHRELRTSRSVRAGKTRVDHHQSDATKLERSQSEGSRRRRQRQRQGQGYRTEKEVLPVVDPPSPKVSFCGFCTVFKKPEQQIRNHHSSPGQ